MAGLKSGAYNGPDRSDPAEMGRSMLRPYIVKNAGLKPGRYKVKGDRARSRCRANRAWKAALRLQQHTRVWSRRQLRAVWIAVDERTTAAWKAALQRQHGGD